MVKPERICIYTVRIYSPLLPNNQVHSKESKRQSLNRSRELVHNWRTILPSPKKTVGSYGSILRGLSSASVHRPSTMQKSDEQKIWTPPEKHSEREIALQNPITL